MANVLVQDSSLTAVGNAIRAKNGSTTLYKPAEMAAAIQALGGGGELKYIYLSANTNGSTRPTIQNDNFPGEGVSYFILIKVSNSSLAYSGFQSYFYDAIRGIKSGGMDGGFNQCKPSADSITYDVATKTFTIDLSDKTGLLYISGTIVFCE